MSATSPAAPTGKPKAAAKKKAPKPPTIGTGIPTTKGWYTVGLRSYNGQPPPRHAVTFGGISFPEYAYDENPSVKNDALQYDQKRRGQRIYLDEEDLKILKTKLGTRIVRVRSLEGNRYVILHADSKAAKRKLRGDLPLERFLYIDPAETPEEAAERVEENVPDSIG